ncbi:hypothetical protein R6Q59_022243 [Mikania micrantha]
MGTNNRRPTQGATGAMESGDWKGQLQRKRIVSKIMDVLKRHLPFSKYERLQELKKIAERIEEEIYTASTSQSEYSRKTCFMMLTIETRLQSPMSAPMRSNSAANSVYSSVPLDSTALTRNQKGGDWQEEVYQKIKAMKVLYLLDLRPTQIASSTKGYPTMAQLQADSRQRVTNKIVDTLKKHLPFSGPEGLQEIRKIAERFEERMYTSATSQCDYLRKISLKMMTMETKYPALDQMQ